MNQKNARKLCVQHMKHPPDERSDFIERRGTYEETDKCTLPSIRVQDNGSNQVTYTRKKGQLSTGNQYLLWHFQDYPYLHFLSCGTTVTAKCQSSIVKACVQWSIQSKTSLLYAGKT
jgi:hypothetical protein